MNDKIWYTTDDWNDPWMRFTFDGRFYFYSPKDDVFRNDESPREVITNEDLIKKLRVILDWKD